MDVANNGLDDEIVIAGRASTGDNLWVGFNAERAGAVTPNHTLTAQYVSAVSCCPRKWVPPHIASSHPVQLETVGGGCSSERSSAEPKNDADLDSCSPFHVNDANAVWQRSGCNGWGGMSWSVHTGHSCSRNSAEQLIRRPSLTFSLPDAAFRSERRAFRNVLASPSLARTKIAAAE